MNLFQRALENGFVSSYHFEVQNHVPIWPDHGQPVRHIGACNAEVGLRVAVPFVVKIDLNNLSLFDSRSRDEVTYSVFPDDLKAGSVGHIKPCIQNQKVLERIFGYERNSPVAQTIVSHFLSTPSAPMTPSGVILVA